MSMRLTRAGVLAGVEEGVQASLLFATCRRILLVGLYARECGLKIRRLEDVSLLLEVPGDEDEVLGDDGELVKHEKVRGPNVGKTQGRWRVLERIEGFLGFGGVWRRAFGFVGQGG
jgi:hypothetical protein